MTARLTGRYLAEYSRRPVNLALLVFVPLVFVVLAAGAISDFARIVGGVGDAGQLAAPTAGWAAAFLAGVAGFFHVLGSRDADRRLATAGMGAWRITFARLASGVALALLASGASVVALAFRTGIPDPVRTIAGTVMFAVIYLGIGVAVGSLVRSDINGSLIVIFIWMLDVFLGPAMAGTGVGISRLFPSHFVTLFVLDSPSGHAGPIGDLGWTLAWTLGALGLAVAVFAAATATRRNVHTVRHDGDDPPMAREPVSVPPAPARMAANPSGSLAMSISVVPDPGSTLAQRRSPTATPPGVSKPVGTGWGRIRAGLRYGLRDHRRNIALWVLLVVLPVLFISLSFYITPEQPTPVELVEGGVSQIQTLSMIDVHGAIMVPITVAFLAGLTGLFVVQGSLEADARLRLAGFRPREILASRLGVIALAGSLTTVVSLAVTAIDFTPHSWAWFTVGNALVAATYGMVGVLIGALFGRLGGLYLMFLLPFIDVGIGQNIMFSAAPPGWGVVLPGRGAVQVLVDGAFTPSFDQAAGLMLAFAWLVVLALAAAGVVNRIAEPRRA